MSRVKKLRSSSHGCAIKECEDPYYAYGWCRRHYDRWRQAGDPLAPDKRFAYNPLTEDFWQHVDADGGPNACWPWKDQINSNGYGTIRRNHKFLMAHRIAYQLAVEPIPAGLYVLHRCDNPPCCNPAHLFLGTHADNMGDMKQKGRGRGGNKPGAANHAAKLTKLQVEQIRSRSDETQAALAREYNVAPSTISRLLSGKRWSGG